MELAIVGVAETQLRVYLTGITGRAALVFGEKSALWVPETVTHMSDVLGPSTSVIGNPQGQHHLTSDQPLAFVSAPRAVLEGWVRPPFTQVAVCRNWAGRPR